MKNIWHIFRRDILRIRNNVIAMIVIMGITVVPCMYAWFNIAGSWDPYSNTGNLKVAVASLDEGYEGNLIPIEMNIGDQVLTNLRANTQMDWIFTSRDKAVEGVKSGKYYAAIVIPKDFSNQMMSIFSEDIQKPEIIYYSNAKENAIAPKVTDKGASAIQKQINESFIETVSDSVLTVLQSVMNMAKATGTQTIADNLSANLNTIAADLTSAGVTLQSFADMTTSTQQLLDTTAQSLQDAQGQTSVRQKTLKDTKKTFSGIQGTLSGTTDSINTAISSSQTFYKQVSDIIDTAFASQGQDAEDVAGTLDTVASRVQKIIDSYTDLRDDIQAIGDDHPELSDLTTSLVDKLNDSIATQKDLHDTLTSTADALRSSATDLESGKKELDALLKKNAKQLRRVKSTYENKVQSSLNQLAQSLEGTESDITGLLTHIDNSADGIYTLAQSANSDLSQLRTTLNDSSELLNQAARRITKTTKKLDSMRESKNFSELESLLSDNKDALSAFLASPVSLNTHEVYAIENYGSSMAPFYSTLSIWIGGIVLVAMLKVTVSRKCTRGLRRVKTYQLYFGRYLIFLIVGLMQSTLIALGDLFYLGIQCEHPFLFLLACWFSSVVYVNIAYTLTVSFGDIGKAISVVLLVVQVAGSGGTFPIECAPAFFRAVYPLLPFVHSMSAMRETIGGMYGMDYWFDLGKLSIFLLISLFVGLVLRKPIIRLNTAFSEKLEETHIM